MKLPVGAAALGWLLTAGAPAFAAPLHVAAGPARVALIELYTSEGCSSCPPAEQWLSGLRQSPQLWHEFVPVSYHVNYWDHLGWKDRFSARAYTERQYAVAAEWGTRSVYTPCFVRNGEEWHPSPEGPGSSPGAPGVLRLDVDEAGHCQVEFRPAASGRASPLIAHLVLLGGGFVSKVTAGENRGSTLTHEFVVLGFADAPLVAGPAPGVYRAALAQPAPAAAGATRLALAVWVTRPGELAPLQAAGGWFGL